jgi:predicted 3-demethylubiquinone-9 3-methyltransferase (glyoxalase superfamily)
MQKITPFLWFDNQAQEAVNFYTSIFENSAIVSITRYGKEGAEASGRPEGSVMTAAFQLAGQEFVALNGGPQFKFTEAISFVVNCESQAKWTITGKSCPKAAMKRRNNAAGLKTDTECPGKSFPLF